MVRIINEVAVFGLGKVGELVAVMLGESGFKVIGYDSAPRDDLDFEVRALDVTDDAALRESLRGVDAIISCLPYSLNVSVAEAAADTGVHYFDLTEDVPTTNRVIELADGAGVAFAPQCGLAPGLIGTLEQLYSTQAGRHIAEEGRSDMTDTAQTTLKTTMNPGPMIFLAIVRFAGPSSARVRRFPHVRLFRSMKPEAFEPTIVRFHVRVEESR